MKKNELRIINTILALSHTAIPPIKALEKMNVSLARLTGSQRTVLLLSDHLRGGLSVATENRPKGKPVTREHFPPDSGLARIAEGLTEAGKINLEKGLDPAWDEYSKAVFIPFKFNGSSGLHILLSHNLSMINALSQSFFNVLGETLSLVIEDLSVSAKLSAKLNEMSVLHEIGRFSSSTLEIEKLLPLVARHLAEALSCNSGHIVLRLKSGGPDVENVRYSWPLPPDKECDLSSFENFNNGIIENGLLELDTEYPLEHEGSGVKGSNPLYLSGFPVKIRNETIGSVVLLHCSPISHTDALLIKEDKKAFMEAVSSLVSMAVDNALNYAEATRLAIENQNQVNELSILFEISQVLAGTMCLDDVFKIILTAATFGHGLSFNRAALFLMNEKTNTLQGMMGVGPENSEEAARIWAELSTENWPLPEVLKMSMKSNVSNTLNAKVRAIRMPVVPESGIIALSVLEKKVFNIIDAKSDPRVNRVLADKLGLTAFAAAPMIAEDKVLGVIAVDNLYNGRPITNKDIQLLTTFTNQAALALNNAQLYNRLSKTHTELKNMYRRLSRSERLAALGEMAATVAHEVRNPLVSVGGFTRRLERRLDEDDPNRRFTGIILKEITRLEKFLNEILIFSRDLPLSLDDVNLNLLIRELADFFHEELDNNQISLELLLDDKLPTIKADSERLSQIIMNLFSNSIDALGKEGRISVQTIFSADGNQAVIHFSDTGGGVNENILQNIFKPFFTTKAKGTGLGLPLVNKLVKHHGGSIEVENKPGESITFIVSLPLTPSRGNGNNEAEEEIS